VICLHCSFENTEGRQFCRNCAKPLTQKAPPLPIAVSTASLQQSANVSTMAVASLVLSFFAFFVPFGIASVVMGHVSRRTILRSGGTLKGTGIAFAGLVNSYLQLAACLLILLVFTSGITRFNYDLNRSPWDRAALVDAIENPTRALKTLAAGAKHQKEAVVALELIRDKQDTWIESHRDSGYACNLSDLGYYISDPSELGLHIRQSHYDIAIRECRDRNEIQYFVMAVPRSGENPEDSPVFCLDQTSVIRKVDAAADIGCRTMGERVE